MQEQRTSIVVELYILRDALHGNVEDSVMDMLDSIIWTLEDAANNTEEPDLTVHEVLLIMGQVFSAIPSIVEIIKLLSK